MNSSQAGDYPGGGSAAPLLVHLIGGVDTQLKKFGITVNEQVNSLAGGKTSFTVLRLDGFLPSALPYLLFFIADGRDQLSHAAHVLFKPGRGRVNF